MDQLTDLLRESPFSERLFFTLFYLIFNQNIRILVFFDHLLMNIHKFTIQKCINYNNLYKMYLFKI